MNAKQTPLADLLDGVPTNIVLGIPGDGPFPSHTNIPIGTLARDAAAELRRLHAEAAKLLEELEHEVAFYRRRVEAMQQWQSRMRDPERTVVCDILANGFTLDPPVPRDRYELKA